MYNLENGGQIGHLEGKTLRSDQKMVSSLSLNEIPCVNTTGTIANFSSSPSKAQLASTIMYSMPQSFPFNGMEGFGKTYPQPMSLGGNHSSQPYVLTDPYASQSYSMGTAPQMTAPPFFWQGQYSTFSSPIGTPVSHPQTPAPAGYAPVHTQIAAKPVDANEKQQSQPLAGSNLRPSKPGSEVFLPSSGRSSPALSSNTPPSRSTPLPHPDCFAKQDPEGAPEPCKDASKGCTQPVHLLTTTVKDETAPPSVSAVSFFPASRSSFAPQLSLPSQAPLVVSGASQGTASFPGLITTPAPPQDYNALTVQLLEMEKAREHEQQMKIRDKGREELARKRRRHNEVEQKRRVMMNGQLDVLRNMLPNCSPHTSKAETITQTIRYIEVLHSLLETHHISPPGKSSFSFAVESTPMQENRVSAGDKPDVSAPSASSSLALACPLSQIRAPPLPKPAEAVRPSSASNLARKRGQAEPQQKEECMYHSQEFMVVPLTHLPVSAQTQSPLPSRRSSPSTAHTQPMNWDRGPASSPPLNKETKTPVGPRVEGNRAVEESVEDNHGPTPTPPTPKSFGPHQLSSPLTPGTVTSTSSASTEDLPTAPRQLTHPATNTPSAPAPAPA